MSRRTPPALTSLHPTTNRPEYIPEACQERFAFPALVLPGFEKEVVADPNFHAAKAPPLRAADAVRPLLFAAGPVLPRPPEGRRAADFPSETVPIAAIVREGRGSARAVARRIVAEP